MIKRGDSKRGRQVGCEGISGTPSKEVFDYSFRGFDRGIISAAKNDISSGFSGFVISRVNSQEVMSVNCMLGVTTGRVFSMIPIPKSSVWSKEVVGWKADLAR